MVCVEIAGYYTVQRNGRIVKMPRKKNVYKELRGTIDDLVLLEGKEKVEEELDIVILEQ